MKQQVACRAHNPNVVGSNPTFARKRGNTKLSPVKIDTFLKIQSFFTKYLYNFSYCYKYSFNREYFNNSQKYNI